MQHLTREELARLVDETPTHEERLHLKACGACRAEREAMREQTALLATLSPPAAPARAWPVLEARLRHERLVHDDVAERPSAAPGRRTLLRAATYVALFLLGGASGAALMRGADPAAGGGTASSVTVSTDPQTPEAAAARLREAEALYLDALGRYGELTGGARYGSDPAAQLAALEGIVLTTRAALEAAPADPVINGYYLTAIGQRDAVLRQIALPADDPWF
jgi:hypothetical protein